MCHISNKVSTLHLGVYGDYMCDTPKTLLDNSIRSAAKIINTPDLILWTGDNTPHVDGYNFDYVVNTINITTSYIKKYFPNTKVIPLFGNHDYAPGNMFPDRNNTVYSETYKIWKDWIGEENKDTFLKGGYYKYQSDDNTTWLCLNTNLYYIYNSAKMDNKTDPAEQFQFMRQELQRAKDLKKFVHVIAHIPPGSFERTPNFTWLYPQYNEQFLDIIIEFADVIKWMVFGHHHTDTFRMVLNSKNEPIQMMFMSPSVTPWFSDLEGAGSNNPAFRIFDYNIENWDINDIETYSINLNKLNNNPDVPWLLEYTFVHDYNISSPITVKNINNLLNLMKKNDTLFSKYLEYNSVGWNVTEPTPKFRCGQLCAIEYADYPRYYKCLNAPECKEHTNYTPKTNFNGIILTMVSLFISYFFKL
uniref:Metallophos domain-containing protein n=1 Tax=Parastrongyloides trichosuri TaxID=131310 RepID=A0A0N4ZSU7_PARTI